MAKQRVGRPGSAGGEAGVGFGCVNQSHRGAWTPLGQGVGPEASDKRYKMSLEGKQKPY